MIEFEKIRFKNLMSYGNNFTEVEFQKAPMTLISGKNGHGKSVAFGEAMIFALFGIPYRNICKPNLVNSINAKECLVEIEFKIGKKKYLIRRGIKPTVFEIIIDGKLLDQNSTSKDYQNYLEQNILKLNYKSFTQLVFLGSSNFVPFMQLPAQERRNVIEELLDLKVFSKMNFVLKEKLSVNKDKVRDIEREIVLQNEKIALHSDTIKKQNNRNTQQIEELVEERKKNDDSIMVMAAQLGLLASQAKTEEDSISDKVKVEKSKEHMESLRRDLLSQGAKNQKVVAFYESHDDCPTCNQTIDVNFKSKIVTSKKEKSTTIETACKTLDEKIEKLNERLQEIRKVSAVVSGLEKDYYNLEIRKESAKQYSERLIKDIDRLQKASTVDLSAEKEKLKELEKILEEKNLEKEEIVELMYYFDISNELLKDSGIKAKIIKQYLPVMNKFINKYLNNLDFFVNFNLDENFKEIIKSRYRDEFEYNSFSQGQKFRIDVALLLTWREISRRKNSTNTNILILDEVLDSSLDGEGTEEFVKLLKTLSKKIHIFVISHKPDVISDKFDRHVKAIMKNNFSVLTNK